MVCVVCTFCAMITTKIYMCVFSDDDSRIYLLLSFKRPSSELLLSYIDAAFVSAILLHYRTPS